MTPIQSRYDFLLLFDVVNGNPNGDPDAGNAPRVDPETEHGLVSDVALKRKIRDAVALEKTAPDGTPEPGYDIYIRHHGVLEQLQREAYQVRGLDLDEKSKEKKLDNVAKARAWMCQTYFDVRAFGAVMSTGVNCGQVRGPVQLTFARSKDPITPMPQSIVRKAVQTQREADKQIEQHAQVTGTMGSKTIVPYGLYEAHGFVSPHLAADTGFSQEDMDLIWKALANMFELDRSATRGEMATRRLIVFEHRNALGNAPAHTLFRRLEARRRDESRPPRAYDDYRVTLNTDDLPEGVTVHEKV
jgi:CRISPR-associated protein Csd2